MKYLSIKLVRKITLTLCFLTGVAMAYDVYISRGYIYDDENFKEITLEEWNTTISEHDELSSVEKIEGENSSTGARIQMSIENSAVYTKEVDSSKVEIYIRWRDGMIITKYTDPSHKKYWEEIAKWFTAEIYGEEGESL